MKTLSQTILIPRFRFRHLFNQMWRVIKPTWIAPFVTHEAQGFSALRFLQMKRQDYARLAAPALYGLPLCGAGSAWESRYALAMEPGATCPLVTTGANSINFNVMDFASVEDITFAVQVALTVTALDLYFDKYSAVTAAGTKTAGLTGTQTDGDIIAPAAAQAIGQVLYKNLSNTLDIDLSPGMSVQALVHTTTTAGSGVPIILCVPRAETYPNLSTSVLSS